MALLGRKKARQENLYSPIRRETRVSKELKTLKQVLDLRWFREAVKEKFVLDNGRPSISPEVLGSMMMLGYWFNITSDRELCDECEDRLSFREFIGISDEEAIPVHSSLTHWRQRLGPEVFRGFIVKSIEAAIKVGLTPGRCRMFDSTLVKAQADASGPSCLTLTPKEQTNDYLDALGEWEDPQLPSSGDDARKAGGSGWKAQEAKRKLREEVPIRVSDHDLDAKMLSHPNKKTDFYHKCHFEFDASSGLVMNADVQHVADAVKMVEFLASESHGVDTAVGDTGYFTGETQEWLADHGISSMISVRDNDNSGGRVFGLDAFAYDVVNDEYVCPVGERLHRFNMQCEGCARYRTKCGVCGDCDLRVYCFRADRCGRSRSLKVSAYREFIDAAKKQRSLWRYRRLSIKRRIWCEGGIGNMKCYGGLGRARGIGRESMMIQAFMAGAVKNLKRVVHLIQNRESAAHAAISVAFQRLCAQLLRQLLTLGYGKWPNPLIQPLATSINSPKDRGS
jgi:IS5 family transposase